MLAVGHFRRELDSAIDGTGREQEQVIFGQPEPLLGHHVKLRILGDGRKKPPLLPLELDAQDVDDVAARKDLVEMIGDFAAEPFPALGDQGRRPAEDHLGPELQEPPDVGAGDAGMSDVAEQADGQPFNLSLGASDRHQVEQPLRGVLMSAVASVNDRTLEMLRQQVRRPRRRMANHHDVGPHGLDVLGGVDERLALRETRAARGEVLSVRREPFGRQAETRTRAG